MREWGEGRRGGRVVRSGSRDGDKEKRGRKGGLMCTIEGDKAVSRYSHVKLNNASKLER